MSGIVYRVARKWEFPARFDPRSGCMNALGDGLEAMLECGHSAGADMCGGTRGIDRYE